MDALHEGSCLPFPFFLLLYPPGTTAIDLDFVSVLVRKKLQSWILSRFWSVKKFNLESRIGLGPGFQKTGCNSLLINFYCSITFNCNAFLMILKNYFIDIGLTLQLSQRMIL